MEVTTWEEIKALASDFKRAQETSTYLKLSERNCIDILNYLCSNKLLSLYFTTDGKTFLTEDELIKEIYEELEFSNGRVTFVSLCNSLELDSYTIENAVSNLIQKDCELQIVMNCLISSTYVRQVSLKINEILKDRGKSTLGELTQLFELPKMFLEKLIINNLGTVIDAHKDGDMLYTNSFVRRHTAMLRGYLTRSSKSVLISSIVHRHSIPEKLVLKIVSDLIDQGRILGKIDSNKSLFIPEIYLKNQRIYLQEFFKQNNYLEFSAMKDVGVQNPTKFAETEFPHAMILSTCILSEMIVSQLEAGVQECNRSDGFLSCYECVPTTIDLKDLLALINKVISSCDSLRIVEQEFIVSVRYIEKCFGCFDEIIKVKSEEYARQKRKSFVTIVPEFVDEDAESSNSKTNKQIKIKSGGGQRGREIKNKAVKNKYSFEKRSDKQISHEDQYISLDFITEDEAIDLLSTKLNDDAPLEMLHGIFLMLEKQLDLKFRKECHSVILQTSDTAKMKAEHQKLEGNITTMMNKIKLFEKAFLEISNISLKNDLIKYCLRSICSDVANCLMEYIAHDNNIDWDPIVTIESRSKLIGQLKPDLANKMKAVIKSLKDEGSLDGFYLALENICAALDLFPKKLDKKNEKRLTQEIGAQYHSVLDNKVQNNTDIDPAELLLITTMLLFQKLVGYPLHASGKFVPDLLNYLQQIDSGDSIDWFSLKIFQTYIITNVKIPAAQEEEKAALKLANKDLQEKILNLALNWKSLKGVS